VTLAPVETSRGLSPHQEGGREVAPGTALVIAHRTVEASTVTCLFELVGRGWPIAIPFGDALIDRGRARAASSWYRTMSEDAEGGDVFLMIDDDIVFKAEDAERVVQIAREKRAIACAAYPVSGGGHLASRGFPGQELRFGPDLEPVEIRWPATGFMAVHRDVIKAFAETMDECYPGESGAFWPMFQPYKLGPDYLSEDYAFGERARELGFATWLDPQSILIHMKTQGVSVYNMPGAEVRER